MRRVLVPAALAAAAAITLFPQLVLADDDNSDALPPDAIVTEPLGADTTFDLGIDVTPVTKTPAAVKAFVSGLSAQTQSILRSTCQHYMENPESVQSRDTIDFCEAMSG